jgi:hypothetical protein
MPQASPSLANVLTVSLTLPGSCPIDDDGGAAGGHDVCGGLASHPAAAADDYQFVPGEDGHGLRPVGLVRVTVQVLEPVPVRVHFQSLLLCVSVTMSIHNILSITKIVGYDITHMVIAQISHVA